VTPAGIEIRGERPGDAAAIRLVGDHAFGRPDEGARRRRLVRERG
jgi:hypothetical protein